MHVEDGLCYVLFLIFHQLVVFLTLLLVPTPLSHFELILNLLVLLLSDVSFRLQLESETSLIELVASKSLILSYGLLIYLRVVEIGEADDLTRRQLLLLRLGFRVSLEPAATLLAVVASELLVVDIDQLPHLGHILVLLGDCEDFPPQVPRLVIVFHHGEGYS